MEEKEYRTLVDKTFKYLEKSFDSIDPDEAEFESAMGTIAIQFSDRTKCILSVQPSVKQIWLANAGKGVAHHFNFDHSSEKWLDDKGKGIELLSYVKDLVKEKTGRELAL